MATISNVLDAAIKSGSPKGQFENFIKQRYIASSKAWEFHAACRWADNEDGPTQIGAGGARGGGKSHLVFAQALLDDAWRFPGLTILYLRRVGKKAREQFENLRKSVLKHTPHRYNRSEGCVYLPNGSKCLVGGFINEGDVDDYLGLEYDIIIIEEHTSLSLVKHRALRDSNRSAKPGWRPRIYSTTNPGGIGHAWYKKSFIDPYKNDTQDDTRFIPMTVDDNPYVDDGYTKKLEENTGWRLRAYRYGDWDIAAGQFFTTWKDDVHTWRGDLVLDPSWTFWASMDYGFTHYTVIHLHCMTHEGIIYTFDEHARQKWIPKRHVWAYTEMLKRHGIELWRIEDIYAGGDVFSKDRDGKCPADDYEELLGRSLKRANMDRISGAAEILNRLGDIESGIQPTWFVHERCYRLRESIVSMEHDPRRPEDVRKVDCDEDGNGGDDFYDSARYGLMVQHGNNAHWGDPGISDWRG